MTLVNPAGARLRLLDCRNALVDARTKLRAALPAAELDRDGLSACPERVAVADCLARVELAISDLSRELGRIAREVARRAASEAAQ